MTRNIPDRKPLNVRLYLAETNEPLVFECWNMWHRANYVCLALTDGTVHEYPNARVWRIVKDYGYSETRGETIEGE
jgi:hypothetical protein